MLPEQVLTIALYGSAQANLPPTVVPVRYSNGQLPAYGTNLEGQIAVCSVELFRLYSNRNIFN